MSLRISAGFPPGTNTPDLVAYAEELGYERAWLYDSPGLYEDVWMTLALCAGRTTRIGLGTGVIVPSLRHPMVTAAAIATLVDLAPGRVAIAIGAGLTGRRVLGQKAMRWTDVREYVLVLKALLAGEEAEWDGAVIRMMHSDGYAPKRPIQVPILIGADGPKGSAVAAELGDGNFAGGIPNAHATGDWRALLTFGTVVDAGEAPDGERVVEAAGTAGAVVLHTMYERTGKGVDNFPGGAGWRESIEMVDPRRRHLAVHEGHLVELTERDRAALAAGMSSMLPTFSFTGTDAELRERLDGFAAAGVTELAYQASGPDPKRELRRFAEMAGIS